MFLSPNGFYLSTYIYIFENFDYILDSTIIKDSRSDIKGDIGSITIPLVDDDLLDLLFMSSMMGWGN